MKKLFILLLLTGCSVSNSSLEEEYGVFNTNNFVYEEPNPIELDKLNEKRNALYCERTNETLNFQLNDASVKLTIPIWCDPKPYKFKGDPSPEEK